MNNQANNKRIPNGLTIKELLDMPDEPTEPYMSSPWEFDEGTLTLNIYTVTSTGEKYWEYQVDLETCRNASEVLDWIMHIAGKTFTTDQILAALVRDLELYLGRSICFGSGTTDVRGTIRKHMHRANILRGNRSTKQAPTSCWVSELIDRVKRNAKKPRGAEEFLP